LFVVSGPLFVRLKNFWHSESIAGTETENTSLLAKADH
jgi:hypothetical protein